MEFKRPVPLWRRLLPALVLVVVLIIAFFFGSRVLLTKAGSEALTLAEKGIRRAAVQCYALEGFYPTSVDYLTAHYGVTVDPGTYIIHYEFVASNLMPDVTVLPRA